ncbi:exodeoxyribonuclease V subunit beta [Oxalobacter vibrioformis]|uniref:RecBCD enzyme subunit RecB n=1 Tax=Oxalobacter vibrioformis TaxID=933080 RepID=A0A9E9P4B7_9BURK|nr:exodeoxyribonuclease V subunit beta [Oxalobacter vibrioformis]WAW09931.1 exodeoxyribonuclease V subunit beta [Oxalobacter vibrioformis]
MTMHSAPDNLDILNCPLSGMSLIEASAGTGKTWNICMLYLRFLLEAKLAVPEILVVTFTNAATAELKERIRARIMEMLLFLEETAAPSEADPFLASLVSHLEAAETGREEMQLLLKAALASFDEATISTIHGFCRKVAGTLAFGTGQPFSFTVEREEKETLTHVVHDFWRRHVAADTLPPAMAMYLNAIRITPEGLAAFLQREMEKPLAQKRWPDDLAPLDESDMDALIAAYEKLKDSWQQYRESLPDVIGNAVTEKVLSGAKYGGRPLPNILAAYESLFARKDPAALSILSDNTARTRLWRLTTDGMADGANKGKTPPPHPFFSLAETWFTLRDEAITRLHQAYLHLLFMLSKEADEVRRRRQENRVLSSSDMLYRLYAALSDPALPDLPAAIRRMYPAALIDEFQDTDPIQFFIFRTIYAGSDAPVFFVGDPKQAIYRFRNADLHTYLAAREEVNALYSLTLNQRSTPEVIAACNAFFLKNPNPFMLDGLGYPPVSPGARQREALADESDASTGNGIVLWRLPHTTDSGYLRRNDAMAAAANAVADEIARLLHAGQHNEIRIGEAPLKAADMAILVRTHNEARRMQQALALRGLASVSLSPGSVWDSPEAAELGIILSAIITPRNLPRLRAALATEMLGLDAPAIEALSAQDEKLLAKVERFMAYQAVWLEHGISFVLRQVMGEHDVYARLLALPDGERRVTNLLHLAELLNDAAQHHAMPESLLRWMTEQRESGASDEETQIRLESDEKLIRIMTIYAAKGLEFPFVFCPFLWDAWRSNRNDSLDGMEYQDGNRLVIDFREHDALSEAAIKNRMAVEDAADRLRLVYVALTRAIYRCYVVAGCYVQPSGRSVNVNHSTSGTLNWLATDAGITPAEWISNGDEERVAWIEAGWQAMADSCDSITLADLPMRGAPVTASPETDGSSAITLMAAPLPAAIPAGWRIGSYSALVYGAMGAIHEAAASDHDERVQDAGPPDEPETVPDTDDIFLFPASRYAGNCLHAVFEEVDFTDESTWDAAIAQALLRHPPYGRLHPEAGNTPEALAAMIRQMLKNVLATPLHNGMTLAGIGLEKRLTELEFFLPAKNVSAPAVNALIPPDYPVSKLAFPQLEGYLKGLIDLVVEHNGRFYILDWKSNLLGSQQADYGEDAIHTAMAEHNYHLQHLLYTVALDRYLSHRMPGYAYDTHFGGVLYLFVRGVRPAWRQENGTPSGVFFRRADERLIRALDALLSGGGA